MTRRFWLIAGLVLVLAAAGGGGYYVYSHRQVLPAGIVAANGRLEATEVDVAAKNAGRVAEVNAEEGDFVRQGQVVAQMDVQETEASLRSAHAQAEQAQRSYEQAKHVVEQRQGELDLAIKELQRDETLLAKGFATQQKVDQERTAKVTAEAALNAAMSAVDAYEAAIRSAKAEEDRLTRQVVDGTLIAPRSGRVLYRLAEPGEVLSAGGKVLTLLDLSDVYMTVFLPASLAGQLAVGADARLLLEPIPDIAIPAKVSFISARAQFTPKQVETQSERDRMMFRAKVRIPSDLVQRYIEQVKTGVTGVAYVRTDPKTAWPGWLESDLTRPAQ
ncbi:HlyD family secretion protein [Azorhizobium doebereinerae]|uniref:HlyD family secretion protein n=1 Tax=Azorhizobium doebereinerae TaxID=281091 RepID=UPI0004187A6C|nr:HlyD family efflux transporter periplasmic adaptor subunit [Azorhizobium doebereinerae]